jgi:hypothetical protein
MAGPFVCSEYEVGREKSCDRRGHVEGAKDTGDQQRHPDSSRALNAAPDVVCGVASPTPACLSERIVMGRVYRMRQANDHRITSSACLTAKTRQRAINVLTLQVLQRLLSQRLWVVLTA